MNYDMLKSPIIVKEHTLKKRLWIFPQEFGVQNMMRKRLQNG